MKPEYDANYFDINNSTFIDLVTNFLRQTANVINTCYKQRKQFLQCLNIVIWIKILLVKEPTKSVLLYGDTIS